MDGDRLALSVTSSDGRVIRWGGDEPDAAMIPDDLELSTAIPGGYKDLSCSLFRALGSDERLFDRVRAYGPGNRTAWDGRLVQFPRDDAMINPGAVGHAAHLRDDPSVREIYVDQDKSHWEAASVQRRLDNLVNTYGTQDSSLNSDLATGQPALATTFNGAWAAASRGRSEAWYNGNIPLGSLYYAWKKGGGINEADANWVWIAHASTNDVLATSNDSGNLRAAGPGTGTLTSPDSTRKSLGLFLYYSGGAGGTENTDFAIFWTCLGVYGTHGLSKHGTPSATEASGFYGDDIIADLVSRWAPLLTVTRGTGGIEANTSFVIPQAAFLDATTVENAVMLINGYFNYEWGVYDDMKFFWRAPDPTRLTWQARKDMGAHISLEGDTAEQQFNGVIVHYTDPSGQKRIAGPPAAYWQGGVAHCDVTNAALVDATSTNPVNMAGIPRRWGVLDIGPVTTDAGAVQLGYVWLAEHALPQRRGSITVGGTVIHPQEGPVPVWRVKAGDGVVVKDLPGDEPRRIIETRYNRGEDTITMTVGNTDYKISAMIERIAVLTGLVT